MWLFLYPYLISNPLRVCVVPTTCALLRGFINVSLPYPQTCDGGYMKEIKAFKSAIQRASHETSGYMTSHLRAEAHASGWPSHVVDSLHVSYGKEGFNVHTPHKETTMDLEYGTPTQRPTAAIRRSANRTTEAEAFLVKRLGKIVGK